MGRKKGLPRFVGHSQGVKVIKKIVKSALHFRIKYITLFAFSTENWNRPKNEVDYLMELFIDSIKNELEELSSQSVSLKFIGNIKNLTNNLKEVIKVAENKTKNNTKVILSIAINYGGKWDIVNATNKILSANLEKVNESQFNNFTSLSGLPDPDLLIRTGGEYRISNFMLWNISYSELYFTDELWPDFDENSFKKVIEAYDKRKETMVRLNNFSEHHLRIIFGLFALSIVTCITFFSSQFIWKIAACLFHHMHSLSG